jgi:hypothetical protein
MKLQAWSGSGAPDRADYRSDLRSPRLVDMNT